MESLTLERILNLVPAKIAVLDSKLRYVFLNDALARSLDVPKRALLGSVLGELKHANSDALRSKVFATAQTSDTPSEFRLDFVDGKGGVSPHHFYLSQLTEQNECKYVILSVDVTTQVAMEVGLQSRLGAIQTLEQYLQAVIDTIPDPIYVRDRNQHWIDANDAFLAMSGLTKGELKARNDFHYLSSDARDLSIQLELKVLSELGSTAQIEEEITLPDGSTRTFSTKRQSRVFPDGRQVVIGVLHDITDQKRRTLEAENSAKMRYFSSRLESLNQMASRLSHEINNPLTIIKLMANSYAEKLRRGQELSPPQLLKGFSDIESASDRIAKLLLAMRAIAQPAEEVSVSTFAVGSAVEKSLPFCLPLSEGKGILFEFLASDTSGERLVTANEVAFSQTLLHILSNAYEALFGSSDGKIQLRIEGNESSVSVFIKDNGGGIPDEIAGKIFDPFFSTKSKAKGVGLGLSVSRQSIRASGGDLKFRTGSWGTEFEIQLPAASRGGLDGK
jgi:PAS domain S-box-containing protein